MENPLIQFSVQIEGYLTTGRYNRIQECVRQLPHPLFSYLMTGLLESIREDIENCVEESYSQLNVQEFGKLVGWTGSEDDMLQSIRERHSAWVVRDGVIVFPRREASEEKEKMATLGDLIRQMNDIEMIWRVCFQRIGSWEWE